MLFRGGGNGGIVCTFVDESTYIDMLAIQSAGFSVDRVRCLLSEEV